MTPKFMLQLPIKKVWLYVCCLSFLLSVGTVGCVGDRLSNGANTPANSTSSASSANSGNSANSANSTETAIATNSSRSRELRDRFIQISNAAQGRVGVTATLLETGESVTLNGDQPFPMQSVYKFPIGMAVLAQVDQGALTLAQAVRVEPSDFVSDQQHSPIRDSNPQGVTLSLEELLRYTVSESDGTGCDVLLRLVGGPATVTQYLRGLGVDQMIVANTEKEIGQDNAVQYRNSATPDAAVLLLQRLHEGQGLSDASRALLLRLMTETPTGLNRIKGLLPEGTVVAHKTGTSRAVDGVTAATNDVGLVTLPNGQHLAIAVFVSDSTADEPTREGVIAQLTRAAWDAWSS